MSSLSNLENVTMMSPIPRPEQESGPELNLCHVSANALIFALALSTRPAFISLWISLSAMLPGTFTALIIHSRSTPVLRLCTTLKLNHVMAAVATMMRNVFMLSRTPKLRRAGLLSKDKQKG